MSLHFTMPENIYVKSYKMYNICHESFNPMIDFIWKKNYTEFHFGKHTISSFILVIVFFGGGCEGVSFFLL